MKKEKNLSISLKPTMLALALMASFQSMSFAGPPPPGPLPLPAADISQNVTNIAPVFNTSNVPVVVSADGGSSTFNPLNLQAGSTVSVTATGAAASVSVSAVNSAFMAPGTGIGNVIQNVSNSSTTLPAVVGGPTGVNNYYDLVLGESHAAQPLIIQLGGSSSAAVGGLIGIGASVSIAATGAVASVSVSGISADGSAPTTLALPTIGYISQYVPGTFQPGVINSATVTNNGSINTIGNMMPGASASISASGAVASVGVSILAANGSNTGGTPATVAPITTTSTSIGQVGQFVVNTNTANVINTGTVTMATPTTFSESLLLDAGSTVSISATGAAAAVSVGMINSSLTGPWAVGTVVQVADNSALVTNTGSFSATVGGSSGPNLPTLGRGASVSIGATGAAASFSISALSDLNNSSVTLPSTISGTFSDSVTAPPVAYSAGISQGVQNSAQITNTGSITSLGNIGPGASASVSATGAVASIGFSANGADMGSTPTNIQGIGQVANNSYDQSVNYYIQNTGTITTGNLGNGASVSVGSTGAVASLNVSAIDGGMASLNITPSGNNPVALIPSGGVNSNPVAPSNLPVYQGAENHRAITNLGTVTTGDLAYGASASISATAAVSSMSFSVINGQANGSAIGTAGTPSIEQRSYNTGNTSNSTQATSPAAAMVVGGLNDGASASISASGAVTSTSVSFNHSFTPTGQGFSFGDIQQYSTNNTAQIINAGSVAGVVSAATPILMTVGSLPGTGASASISASGAVTSVSYSSIEGQPNITPPASAYLWNQSFGAVNQTALNQNEGGPTGGNIVNNGVITIGGLLTGVNSSASVGATGAATSFAVSSVADPVLTNTLSTGPITQVASNAGVINNTGTITFTGANPATLGVGSSVSVSATGAVSSVSYRAVNTGVTK